MVEYFKNLKNKVPDIFGLSKVSSRPMQIDAINKKKSPIVEIFINNANNQLIAVTQSHIEVHDLKLSKKVAGFTTPSTVVCAAFTEISDFGPVLVVTYDDQKLVIFEINELIKLKTIDVAIYEAKRKVSVTCINVDLGKQIIIGYSNGVAKMYHLKSSKEEKEFKANQVVTNQMEEFGMDGCASAISHIQISLRHKLVYLAHEELLISGSGESIKLQKTPINVFNYESGDFVTDYKFPNLHVQQMIFYDTRNALILLSSGQRTLYIINTAEDHICLQVNTDFEGISDECLINNMYLEPITKRYVKQKYPKI